MCHTWLRVYVGYVASVVTELPPGGEDLGSPGVPNRSSQFIGIQQLCVTPRLVEPSLMVRGDLLAFQYNELLLATSRVRLPGAALQSR